MCICACVYASAYLHAIIIDKKNSHKFEREWESSVYGSSQEGEREERKLVTKSQSQK